MARGFLQERSTGWSEPAPVLRSCPWTSHARVHNLPGKVQPNGSRGQTLIITAGAGLAQREGGPIEKLRPGDVVWFAPGEKHWHGASPATAMTHIAIQERLDGKAVDWMEHVSDEEYAGKSSR